jgi:hypothetical protein
MDVVAKKNSCSCQESRPGRQAYSLATILTELPQDSNPVIPTNFISGYKCGSILFNTNRATGISFLFMNIVTQFISYSGIWQRQIFVLEPVIYKKSGTIHSFLLRTFLLVLTVLYCYTSP